MPLNDAHFYEYFAMLQQRYFTLALSYVHSMWYLSVYNIYALEREIDTSLFFLQESTSSLPYPCHGCSVFSYDWNSHRCHIPRIEQTFYDVTNENILSYDLRLSDFLRQRKSLCRCMT